MLGIIIGICVTESAAIIIASIALLFPIALFTYEAVAKAFTPIFITDKKIRQGKTEYEWESVKITAVPIVSRNGTGYALLLRTAFVYGIIECKKEMRRGLCVIANPKVLNALLPHYNDKVLVLDTDGEEDIPRSYRKVNDILGFHNAIF